MNILIFIFLLLVVLPVWGDWYLTDAPENCPPGPRCRRVWSSLSDTEKKNYMNLILKMKSTNIPIRSGLTRSLYDVFVDMHSNAVNTAVWHGTSNFMVVHRWLVWQYESGLRYICRKYGSTLNPPITDCCSIALPYWNWEVDYENSTTDNYVPQDHSAVFDTNYLGPAPVPNTVDYTVQGATINSNSWPTVTATNNNPDPNYFSSGKGLTNTLKRWMNSVEEPFTTGPVTIINLMNSNPNYGAYDGSVEATPHSTPHIWLGFQMETMSSPDDPFFMLHHCNVDRLFALWQDCWDYELVPSSALTTNQYQALNPISGNIKKVNYQTGKAYDVGIDTSMLYWWRSSGSGRSVTNQDSVLFPQANWPKPRDMHFIGNATQTGFGGMYYVYGPDNIVSLIQELSSTSTICPKNTQWRLVNADCGSSKRGISRKDHRSTNEKNCHGFITSKWEELKKNQKNDTEAWKQLVEWECQSTPKVELTPQLEAWISMTGLEPALWDRVCDSVSEKWTKKHGGTGKQGGQPQPEAQPVQSDQQGQYQPAAQPIQSDQPVQSYQQGQYQPEAQPIQSDQYMSGKRSQNNQ